MNYICFETIGIGDRLGSQMGNFAAIYAVSKKTGHKIAIEKNKLNFGKGQQMMLDAFEYPFTILDNTQNFKIVEIKEFAIYYPNVERVSLYELDSHTNYKIVGRLDGSQNVYADIIEDIQNNFFVFKSEHALPAEKYINQIRQQSKKEIVSLHFRRTDYLDCALVNLTFDYYQEALSYFDIKKHCLLLFSDDINFCKTEVYSFLKQQKQNWDVYISKDNTSYIDMYTMSLCDHNIIANSSFSFMAAILNKNVNKLIISPKCCFNTEIHPFYEKWNLVTTI